MKIKGLEPHVYSLNEYKQMEDTIKKMIEDGVVVFKNM